MGNSIRVEGANEMIRKMQAAGGRFRTACVRAVSRATFDAHADMVRTLSQPGAGNVYTHYFLTNKSTGGIFQGEKRDKPHRASAAGDPPAVDNGDYRASWQPKVDTDGMGGEIATNIGKLATWLEYGTPRMAARPHAGPVAERTKGFFVHRVEEEMKRAEREVAE
jgi:hypothetical protein